MPFGLCNAPTTQQHYIEAVLNGLIWRCCFAYVDDIICFSNFFEKHLEDLREKLERLKEHNLILQPLKYSFCKPTFKILGFVTTKDGLLSNPKKVKAIQNYSLSKSPKKVEIFIGMVTWLKRFISNLFKLTFHLKKAKTLKESKFFLLEKAKEEFQILKDILKKKTYVAHPDLSKRFFIHVDASSWGLEAILTQLDDKSYHRVIKYASKVLTSTQQKYTNSVREELGIICALKNFKYYVHRREPIIVCNCPALYSVFSKTGTKIPEHTMLHNWVA